MGDCYICGEETDKGKKNFALGEWIYLCSRACDDEYDPYEAESFDAEVKDRHPTLSKKAKSEYVFPERKAYPIGDEKHAMLALVYSTWPNNKKDASEVRRKVFQRYPQLRTEFMDGKYETRNAESFDAEVYAIEDGGKTELSFQELFDYLNGAIDNEYFLTKRERDDYYEKYYKEYEAESFDAKEYSYYHRRKAYNTWRKNYEESGILQDRKRWGELYDSYDNFKSQGFSKGESMIKSMKELGLYNQLMRGVNEDAFLEFYGAESFDADWDNAPYGSWDEAWSDEISFPMGEKPEKLWLKNLSVIAVLAGAIWVGKQTRK